MEIQPGSDTVHGLLEIRGICDWNDYDVSFHHSSLTGL